MASPLPDLVFYTRPGCHLCDEARGAIELVLEDRKAHDRPAPTLVERDIDADPDLQRAFFDRIPVVDLGGNRIELIVTVGKLRRLFAEVLGSGIAEVAEPDGAPEREAVR